jgi:hypothetical protein
LERERIQGIEEHALPGYEAIVAEAKKDGKSTGADVAMRIVKAENQLRTKKLEEIRGEAPKPVPAVAVDGVLPEAEKKEKTFEALVEEHQTEHNAPVGMRSGRWPRRIPMYTRSSSNGKRQDQAAEYNPAAGGAADQSFTKPRR